MGSNQRLHLGLHRRKMKQREIRKEREAIAETRGRRLVELVRPHLSINVQVTGPRDAWALVGPGLIARQVGTLEAILALRPFGREADAFILLRSLYEHAVTFAWLAADPGEQRHQRFLKSDAATRIAMDDDARRVGEPMLSTEKRSEFEGRFEYLPKQMPDLVQLAEGADHHWTGKIDGLAGSSKARSYRGLYAIAYRHHSAIAHPTLMGLNRVSVDLKGGLQRVQLEERQQETHGPFGLGNNLLGLSLQISAATLGWPISADVNAVFEVTN